MSSSGQRLMQAWVAEPRDTLLVRDGRPNISAGEPMRTLGFPWPSTIAGMVRTRCGLDAQGVFKATAEQSRQIPVAGPLLAELDRLGDVTELMVPAPRDCLWHEDKDESTRWRLVPQAPPVGGMTDLGELALLGPAVADGPVGKVSSGPAFWRWRDLAAWLVTPEDKPAPWPTCSRPGLPGLVRERRIHVAINPAPKTAVDGLLFATEALRFTLKPGSTTPGEAIRLGLWFLASADPLSDGMTLLGGERRPSFLRRSAVPVPALPVLDFKQIPARMRVRFPEVHRAARVVLLTPSFFAKGCSPKHINGQPVLACAVYRPEVISGWDYALNRPKPSRRAAPAGSVYWVQLPDSDNESRLWAEGTFLSCIADDEQDQRDGFGLCVVGVA